MRATLIDERDVTEEIHDAVFRVWGHLNGDGAVAVYEMEGASLVETIDWARANLRTRSSGVRRRSCRRRACASVAPQNDIPARC